LFHGGCVVFVVVFFVVFFVNDVDYDTATAGCGRHGDCD